jgi:hypothetical protein
VSSGGRKRTAAAPPPQRPKRARHSTGAEALANIASSANEFNDIFGGFRAIFAAPAAAEPAAATAPGVNTQIFQPSPVRKTDAIIRAQKLETYLLPSDLAILVNILGNSAAKADLYNALIIDAVRVGWVQDQLRKHTREEGLDFY